MQIYIGAHVADTVPTYDRDHLVALFDACASGDIATVERLIEVRPTMVPLARMTATGGPTATADSNGSEGLGDYVRDFWRKHAEKNPRPIESPGVPVKVSVSPGADERLTRIAREFFGDDSDA